jgi:hypothetical protein
MKFPENPLNCTWQGIYKSGISEITGLAIVFTSCEKIPHMISCEYMRYHTCDVCFKLIQWDYKNDSFRDEYLNYVRNK